MLVYIGTAGYFRLGGPGVENNQLVDRTESQICASYGQAATDQPGYQSLGLYVPPSLPPGPVRTLIFHPGGLLHPGGGTLWVWLAERDGVWVCFQSCWYADNVKL